MSYPYYSNNKFSYLSQELILDDFQIIPPQNTDQLKNSQQEMDLQNNHTEQREYVSIEDMVIGKGPQVKTGDTISVHYKGCIAGSEDSFCESSSDAFQFQLGSDNAVVPGWNIGIPSMNVGSKRRLICAPEAGYGIFGIPSVVPPSATLIFEIEVVAIREVE